MWLVRNNQKIFNQSDVGISVMNKATFSEEYLKTRSFLMIKSLGFKEKLVVFCTLFTSL